MTDDVRLILDHVNWTKLSASAEMSESFINKYSNYLKWNIMCSHATLTMRLMDKYSDRLDWKAVSRYQKLSNKFILKYRDKVDWTNICKYQKLSEETILECIDKISWRMVMEHQTLSEEFISRYWDMLPIKADIIKYQKISEKFVSENMDKQIAHWPWSSILKYQSWSEEDIGKHCHVFSRSNWYFLIDSRIISYEFAQEYLKYIPVQYHPMLDRLGHRKELEGGDVA